MPFMFTARQLGFLCAEADRLREIGGSFVEIGCAWGATTVFLNRHLASTGQVRRYICIDTFEGFTAEAVAYEREHRRNDYDYLDFRANSARRFRRTLRGNNVTGVEDVRADAGVLSFKEFAPIAFCLLDVDLYLPTVTALPRIAECMADGGTIVVDDCLEDPLDRRFDGAGQAFRELRHLGRSSELLHDKLGVIRF